MLIDYFYYPYRSEGTERLTTTDDLGYGDDQGVATTTSKDRKWRKSTRRSRPVLWTSEGPTEEGITRANPSLNVTRDTTTGYDTTTGDLTTTMEDMTTIEEANHRFPPDMDNGSPGVVVIVIIWVAGGVLIILFCLLFWVCICFCKKRRPIERSYPITSIPLDNLSVGSLELFSLVETLGSRGHMHDE